MVNQGADRPTLLHRYAILGPQFDMYTIVQPHRFAVPDWKLKMETTPESNTFFASATSYEQFMGRYARPLAKEFVKSIPLQRSDRVLDIGCGPGALTAELVAAVGADHVSAIDPSPPFLAYCASQYRGITAEVAQAENIPFADHVFDAVFSQLVIHFIGDLNQAGREIVRVAKPGSPVSMCTWNIAQMEKLNLLPRAAQAAGVEVQQLRVEGFGEDGSVATYLKAIGLMDVEKYTINVTSTYTDFDELWGTYLLSIGPMGPWTSAQSDDVKSVLRDAMFKILNEPAGAITLHAEARVARGKTPA